MKNTSNTLAEQINLVCDELRDMLLEKNRKYGNSAIEPLNVFSALGPEEGVRVRIDDKLKRVVSGQCDDDEDIPMDLAGYMVLLTILLRNPAI